ncbi:DUF998 domain-containing protein [Microbacterium sp. NPDC058345]|uniref:DUF998 domain-containing protein n=1 Tax=Microbacterium sp. NPDC058345 TaxID=3346455 RepID=UPI00366229A0
MTTRTTTGNAAPTGTTHRPNTARLLLLAALAGPAFYLSSLLQALTRPGFDIRIHPLSQLASGELGWIQVLSFVIAGLGGLALSAGYRRIRPDGFGRRWAPLLIAGFGLGFILAGLFPMDRQNGFPVGAPEGTVPLSWHAIVHVSAAAVSFLSLAVACILLVVRSVRQRHAAASIGHGVVALVLLLPTSPTESSIQIALTGLVAFTWVTVVAIRLRACA